MPEHRELVAAALKAIDAVASDKSVDLEVMRGSLEEIQYAVDTSISALDPPDDEDDDDFDDDDEEFDDDLDDELDDDEDDGGALPPAE